MSLENTAIEASVGSVVGLVSVPLAWVVACGTSRSTGSAAFGGEAFASRPHVTPSTRVEAAAASATARSEAAGSPEAAATFAAAEPSTAKATPTKTTATSTRLEASVAVIVFIILWLLAEVVRLLRLRRGTFKGGAVRKSETAVRVTPRLRVVAAVVAGRVDVGQAADHRLRHEHHRFSGRKTIASATTWPRVVVWCVSTAEHWSPLRARQVDGLRALLALHHVELNQFVGVERLAEQVSIRPDDRRLYTNRVTV